ncbi:MAG: DNA-binding protein [Candidatus Hodarchaeota archaeon]
MSEDDPTAAEIQRRRLAQLQSQMENQAKYEKERQEALAQRRAILAQILTDKARERLSNIHVVNPQYAIQLENQLIQLYSTRQLRDKITDEQLRAMLQQLAGRRREGNIQFKRK